MSIRFLCAIAVFASVCSYPNQARAQNARTATVNGRVIDQEGNGLPTATAALYSVADSSLISGAVTNDEGVFAIDRVIPGTYWVRVSFVGFVSHESDEFDVIAGAVHPLPTITLFEDAVALAAVNVDAERDLIEVQPDKTVLNVQGTINSTGSNGLELLKKAPGVVVDNNDNIILSGKNGVQVYIDGKPSPLSTDDLAAQLRSMQASEIDAIEIITNPGAKYEAEGNAGIINIRLRRDMSLGFNSTLDLGYRQGEATRYDASSTFNYRTSAINTFGSYAFSGGNNLSWMDIYRVQNNVLFDQVSTSKSKGPGNRFRLGNDFFVGDKAIVGLLVSGYINDRNNLNTSRTPIVNLSNNVTESILEASTDNNGVRRNVTANGNFRWDNRDGISSNADVDFGVFHNGSESFQPNYYRDPNESSLISENIFVSRAPTNISILAGKFDHERTLGTRKLGIGGKVSSVETDNKYSFFRLENATEILDVDRSNDFLFRESIGAGYVNFSGSQGRFDYSAGFRAELTQSRGELTAFKPSDDNIVKREYIDLFPSGGVSFRANENNQFRLNYSRRIDRPSYSDLNPFEYKLDELTFAKGNPFLQPQYTNSLSLTHTFKYLLNTSVSYSNTSDFFARISDTTGVSSTVLASINMDYQKVWSATVSYPYSPKKWWNTYTSLTGFNTRNRTELSGGRIVDVQTTTGNVYHQSSFTLPKAWTLELSGWLNTPSLWGAVYKVETNYSVDTGVRKRLLDGRADLKVAVTDIFKTAPWRAIQDFSGFYMDVNGGWDSRQVRVSFSYLFGNSQVKKARERKTSTADEASRVQ